jgi:hypothetical protein
MAGTRDAVRDGTIGKHARNEYALAGEKTHVSIP